jgi:hypothetical protein
MISLRKLICAAGVEASAANGGAGAVGGVSARSGERVPAQKTAASSSPPARRRGRRWLGEGRFVGWRTMAQVDPKARKAFEIKCKEG